MPEDVEQLAMATPPVEIETGDDPAASVIWLHGLGADGHDFGPVVPQLHLPKRMPHKVESIKKWGAKFILAARLNEFY